MSDAAEVLDALYGEIKSAAGKLGRGSARRGVDTLFGLAVRERVECARCGKSTHESSYLQYFYTTQVGVRGLMIEGDLLIGPCASRLQT